MTVKLPVYNISGEVVRHLEASDDVFAVPFNEAVVHQAMLRQRANARQGTLNTKTRGDVNASGAITLGDIVHLVNYLFDKDRLPCLGTDPGNCWTPVPFCRGDVNTSASITIGDVVHLVNYIFDKDRLPCLGSDPGNCWTFNPFCRGDVNQSGTLTLSDVLHLVNYLFDKDNPPCLGSDPVNCWIPEANGACCLAVP